MIIQIHSNASDRIKGSKRVRCQAGVQWDNWVTLYLCVMFFLEITVKHLGISD